MFSSSVIRLGAPCVAYLLRAADAGWRQMAAAFQASFIQHRPGVQHRFLLLLKGFGDADAAELVASFAALEPSTLRLPDEGYDIATYFTAARVCPPGPICFLNSHSTVLCSYWLAKLVDAFAGPGVGMVGATGTYERQAHEHFPPFPNRHLRTNCFVVDRDDFLLSHRDGLFPTKMDAFAFESGAESLTRYFLRDGRGVLVVGRDGIAYDPETWHRSGTFRAGRQHNLLVGDNHTRAFDAACEVTKASLAALAWGAIGDDGVPQPVTPTPVPPSKFKRRGSWMSWA